MPGTGWQLVILLLFVIPGTVFQAARARLRGPTPVDQDATARIVRAIAVSTVLNAVYAFTIGPSLAPAVRDLRPPTKGQSWDTFTTAARGLGLWALVLLFLVPVLLATLDYMRVSADTSRYERFAARHWWAPVWPDSYDPTPRAWDYAFNRADAGFVRVLTGDGRWVGGWYGANSFAASYPEPAQLFLEEAWILDEDGKFVSVQPYTSGVYVRCDDALVVEFLAPVQSSAPPTPRPIPGPGGA